MLRTIDMGIQREVTPGEWVHDLPLPPVFVVRLRDAWEVLQGRAQAIRPATQAECEEPF